MAQERTTRAVATYDEPELWRVNLGSAFSDLAPEPLEPAQCEHSADPMGALRGLVLGSVAVFTVSGTPQVVQRTSKSVRCSPGNFRRDLENPALLHRSVAALAARWCFVDAVHFSRVFRDSYGFPTSQARAGASPLSGR